MSWYVSRQCYWGVDPEDQNCVEIAAGGLDYANPDMLVSKYDGEGEEYTNPIEAVEAALKIRDAWKTDAPTLTINVAHGATGGNTMPFEGDTDEVLRAWATEYYATLPKCDHCGELLGKEKYHLTEYPDAGEFCREYCADKYYTNNFVTEEEEV
jgi:hypothetical protein